MYIWIFLATIMVALSFLNLSQRPDKDNTISEVKAATVVNRFKAEHLAVFKTAECEIIMKDTDAQGWFTDNQVSPFPPAALNPENMDLGYTKYADNLPIGYENNNSLDVKHYVYCFEKQIETATNNNRVSCRNKSYNYVYVVSYAEIPLAWHSKELNEDDTPVPVPALTNALSKSVISTSGSAYGVGTTSVYGWTQCDGSSSDDFGCSFLGNNAKVEVTDDAETEGNTGIKYTILGSDSIMWKGNEDLVNTCSGTPCFFAYDRIDRTNKKRCKSLVDTN